MLSTSYFHGVAAGFKKYALNPPTQVDEFLANVEHAKDIPMDPTSSINGAPMQGPPPQPPPPVGLADMMSRGAAPGPMG